MNVFWGHWFTGALKNEEAGWWHADAISWVPGVKKIWATEGADLVQLLEDSNMGGALRLDQYVGLAHGLVSGGQTADLRPLGIQLLQAALKVLPEPKLSVLWENGWGQGDF